jgi:hypothetical protein
MKIKIEPNSISFEEIKTALVNRFPDYQFTVRKGNFIIAKKNSFIGCNILLRRKRIVAAGNFPEMNQQMLFNLVVIFLGVIIPLVIYFAFFHKKFKEFEKEIGEFLVKKYAVNQ